MAKYLTYFNILNISIVSRETSVKHRHRKPPGGGAAERRGGGGEADAPPTRGGGRGGTSDSTQPTPHTTSDTTHTTPPTAPAHHPLNAQWHGDRAAHDPNAVRGHVRGQGRAGSHGAASRGGEDGTNIKTSSRHAAKTTAAVDKGGRLCVGPPCAGQQEAVFVCGRVPKASKVRVAARRTNTAAAVGAGRSPPFK